MVSTEGGAPGVRSRAGTVVAPRHALHAGNAAAMAAAISVRDADRITWDSRKNKGLAEARPSSYTTEIRA
jgi:hypothetical protein